MQKGELDCNATHHTPVRVHFAYGSDGRSFFVEYSYRHSSGERAWAARAESPTQHVWHFAARWLNCFLYSFSSRFNVVGGAS